MPDPLIIFQGSVVVDGPRGETNTRMNGWFNEDGSAELVLENPEGAASDVTITIPAQSVGLDLRVALGHTSKVSQQSKPPASVHKKRAAAARKPKPKASA